MKRLFAACFAAAFACAVHAQSVLYPMQPVPAVDGQHIAVTGTAGNITVPGGGSNPGGTGIHQIVVSVDGSQAVFWRCDGTTATTSGAGEGARMPAGQSWLISLAYNVTTCSAIAATTGSTLSMSLWLGN